MFHYLLKPNEEIQPDDPINIMTIDRARVIQQLLKMQMEEVE